MAEIVTSSSGATQQCGTEPSSVLEPPASPICALHAIAAITGVAGPIEGSDLDTNSSSVIHDKLVTPYLSTTTEKTERKTLDVVQLAPYAKTSTTHATGSGAGLQSSPVVSEADVQLSVQRKAPSGSSTQSVGMHKPSGIGRNADHHGSGEVDDTEEVEAAEGEASLVIASNTNDDENGAPNHYSNAAEPTALNGSTGVLGEVTEPTPYVSEFPSAPDKSDNADIWKTYVTETDVYDKEMIEGWNGGIDVFLVFTGLFSAILSAFLIYSWTLLQPDNVQATVDALVIVSQQLALLSAGQPQNSSVAYQAEPFIAPLYAIAVNALWFTGLFISLFAAVTGMLVKEWLTVYKKDRKVVPLKRVEQRQLRYDGLLGWHVPTIATFLPLAIHLALFLFFTGLVILAWPVSRVLSIWMAILLVIGFCLYFASALAPIWYEGCPYKSPLYGVMSKPLSWATSIGMCLLRAKIYIHYIGKRLSLGIRRAPWWTWTDSEQRTHRAREARESFKEFETGYGERRKWDSNRLTLLRKQEAELENNRMKLQFEAVTWLFKSPNQLVQEQALFFLSWWRLPLSWWGAISDEAPEVAARVVRERGSLMHHDEAGSEALNNLALLLPFLSRKRFGEADDCWRITERLKPGPRNQSPDSNLNARLDILNTKLVRTRLWQVLACDAPNELVLCLGLDSVLPVSREPTLFDWATTIIVLEEMASRIQAYPEYKRLLVKYMDALEQVLSISGKAGSIVDRDDLEKLLFSLSAANATTGTTKISSGNADDRDSNLWDGRYFDGVVDMRDWKTQYELGSRLMLIIFTLFPKFPRPPWWKSTKLEAHARRIRCVLIELATSDLYLTMWYVAPPSYLAGVQFCITSFMSERTSEKEIMALQHLVNILLQRIQTWELFGDSLTDGFATFHWALQYIDVSEHHWAWLQTIFEDWIECCDSALVQGRPSVPLTSFMAWLVTQIRTPSTPICTAAIIVPFATLCTNANARDSQGRKGTDLLPTIDCLIAAQWPQCMLKYGFDYILLYGSSERVENKDKLLSALKVCMEMMHQRRPVEIEESGLWKKYNEFGGWPETDLASVWHT